MIDPETQRQIEEHTRGGRPMVVCDVDEVVVKFVSALERHLDDNGYWLDARSFALTGNVKNLSDDVPATQHTVGELIWSFFDTQTASLELVPGAADAMHTLAEKAEIIFLTNMPGQFRDERIENLLGHGLHYPVVTNTGAKGPAVIELAKYAHGPVFFLDDAPSNIVSVSQSCPDAHIIHFIADARFAAVLEEVDNTHLRTSDWPEARDYIVDNIPVTSDGVTEQNP